jgi:hypothetical protein
MKSASEQSTRVPALPAPAASHQALYAQLGHRRQMQPIQRTTMNFTHVLLGDGSLENRSVAADDEHGGAVDGDGDVADLQNLSAGGEFEDLEEGVGEEVFFSRRNLQIESWSMLTKRSDISLMRCGKPNDSDHLVSKSYRLLDCSIKPTPYK